MLKEINKNDTKLLRDFLDSRTQEISGEILLKVSDDKKLVVSGGDKGGDKQNAHHDDI